MTLKLEEFMGFELPESEIAVLKDLEKILSKEKIFDWGQNKWRIEVKDSHVISLYLRKCSLAQIPKIISNLRFIERLFFEDNKISMLPEFLGELENLKYLRIQGNPIESLPQWIVNRHPTVKSPHTWIVIVPSVLDPDATFTIYLKDFYEKDVDQFETKLKNPDANQKDRIVYDSSDQQGKRLFNLLENYLKKGYTPQQILDLLNDRLLEFSVVKTNSEDLISEVLLDAFAYGQFSEKKSLTPQIKTIIKEFAPLLGKNLLLSTSYYHDDKFVEDGDYVFAFKKIMKHARLDLVGGKI